MLKVVWKTPVALVFVGGGVEKSCNVFNGMCKKGKLTSNCF